MTYEVIGNQKSDQAEQSSANPLASTVQMRILIELQVISMLLANNMGSAEDLASMRASVAASIT